MKVDPAATAQALARQLLRHLPHPAGAPSGRTAAADDVERRVLDAAAYRFAQQGVSATTMAQLARDVGISREWLYRHFRNRNAVLAALALREIQALLEGVAERATAADDVVESAVEAFTYVVDVVRSHPLLQRVLEDEPQRLVSTVADHGDTVLAFATDAVATMLTTVGDVEPGRAELTAQTLCRLALATAIAPGPLRDREAMASYLRALLPALLAPAPAGQRPS